MNQLKHVQIRRKMIEKITKQIFTNKYISNNKENTKKGKIVLFKSKPIKKRTNNKITKKKLHKKLIN